MQGAPFVVCEVCSLLAVNSMSVGMVMGMIRLCCCASYVCRKMTSVEGCNEHWLDASLSTRWCVNRNCNAQPRSYSLCIHTTIPETCQVEASMIVILTISFPLWTSKVETPLRPLPGVCLVQPGAQSTARGREGRRSA